MLERRTRRAGVVLAILVGGAVFALSPRTAQAEEPPPVGHGDDLATAKKHDKHYLRAGLEVGGIVAIGFVDYLLNTSSRGGLLRDGDQRWELRYSWPDLRGKLVGSAYELDSNRFGTNYASHPFAGTLYYQAARSSHLSFAESFLFAVLGSSTWEYFGEIREPTSVNDLIVTPTAGAAIAEPMMQLATFFDRGKKQWSNSVLSFLFAPLKFVNDVADGYQPPRAARTDALGFPRDPWHRFELSAGLGITSQSSTRAEALPRGAPRAAYGDLRFGLDMGLANLPGYGGSSDDVDGREQGSRSLFFDDGNIANVGVGVALSGGQLVDLGFRTRSVPIGWYGRDVRGAAVHRGVVGLRIGFEYVTHDYDRDRARPRDMLAFVSPVGVALEHAMDLGPFAVKTSLDLYGSFAGVQPYALFDYSAVRPLDGFGDVVKNNGYYHGYAVTAAPAIDVRYGPLSAGAALRLDEIRPILGIHGAAADRSIRSIYDRRSSLRAYVSWEPAGTPLRFSIAAERNARAGGISASDLDTRASRSETTISGTVGVLF